MVKFLSWAGGGLFAALNLIAAPVLAQSIVAAPDGTGTNVSIAGNTYHIQGGTQAGANLFHSFDTFGLDSGEVGHFLHQPGVTDIFGHVTGGAPSVLNGLLQVTGGNVNLYLMNPAGIVFGADARLDLNGDFVATTSDRIGFETGWLNAAGPNNYATLVGTPNQFTFLSHEPGAILNFGDLSTAGNIRFLGGAIANHGKITADQIAIAAIPGTRNVNVSQPGMLLSLEIAPTDINADIPAVDLPTLLTGANLDSSLTQGEVLLAGTLQGSQLDFYTTHPLQSPQSGTVLGDTRVIRFTETGENPNQAVFIDRRADQPEDLLFGAAAGTITQIIEKNEEGIGVVTEELGAIADTWGEMDSVAIVAEGNKGNFWLGSQWVRSENIENYAGQLQTWGQSLSANADILLYSCFTALGATGEAFVTSIANLTGADVAASVNATGSANYGGDWQLEHEVGNIETTHPFAAVTLDTWLGKLNTRTVDNTGDIGNRTLRDALTTGNGFGNVALAAGDNIEFSISGNITLSSAIAWGADGVTLDGSGQNVVIDGGSSDRIFDISANNATLKNLTIQNGSVAGNGGGIRHTGTGQLTLENTTITQNRLGGSGSYEGGGVFSNGSVSVSNSTITDNVVASAGATQKGGGISVNNSSSSLTIQNSTIARNIVNGASYAHRGGGVYARGSVTIEGSTIANNQSKGDGGGVYGVGNIAIIDSTILGNTAFSNGGGAFTSSGSPLTVTNSTVSGNEAKGSGGGLNSAGSITLTNATIAFNTANSDNVSGTDQGNGGGVFSTLGDTNHMIRNTIIANNRDLNGTDTSPDFFGRFGSLSSVQNSLITDTRQMGNITLTTGVNGNIIGQDPQLQPLANNGGATQTHALAATSPARNSGNNSLAIDPSTGLALTTDQTGAARIIDGVVDIGAYEQRDITPAVSTDSSATVSNGSSLAGFAICDLLCTPVGGSGGTSGFATGSEASGASAGFNLQSGSEQFGDSTGGAQAALLAAETQMTNDYTDLAESDEELPEPSFAEIQGILRNVVGKTGTQPALLYINFIPRNLTTDNTAPETLIASADLTQLPADHRVNLAQTLDSAAPEDVLQLILVTPRDEPIVVSLLEVNRGMVMQQARRFRRSLSSVASGQRYLQSAQQLYDWLIKPVQPNLEAFGIENLAVIADEGARSLPMVALHDGERFLVEQYSVGLVPSLSLIDWRHRPLDNVTMLAMGASEFVGQGPLPAVPTELDLITHQKSGESYLDEQFTYTNLKDRTQNRQFRILHLATHATFRAGSADEAYIQLWDNDTLQLKSLRSLNLHEDPAIELLVLSACETALGDSAAELGFAGAAIQAGVKSVLASLWQVSDLGTLALMNEFYAQLTNPSTTTKAGALRQAQLSLLQGNIELQSSAIGSVPLSAELARYSDIDLTHPYYWSSFTLVGSPW